MTIRFRCKCGRKFEVPDDTAGRKARCTDCGLTFLVPSPPGAPAKAAAPAGSASRPPAPPVATRPAAPPRQAPPPPTTLRPAEATYGLQDDADDVPMARLVPEPTPQQRLMHHGRHKPRLTAVQVVVGISVVIALVVAAESVVTVLGAVQAKGQGLQLIHGMWALCAGLGIIIALAAGSGSRFCIGVLMGGGVVNVLNCLGLLGIGLTGGELLTDQGQNFPLVVIVAGVVALLTGGLYIALPLLSRPVRKYLGASSGVVIGGAVAGFLLGPLVASTALPSPGMVWTRYITTVFVQENTFVAADGTTRSMTKEKKNEVREEMMENMGNIQNALSQYVLNRGRLPADMGLLVNDRDCMIEWFVCPASQGAKKLRRGPQGVFLPPPMPQPDVVYVFRHGRSAKQYESDPNAAQMVVAYSNPKTCGLGKGALVMRMPGMNLPAVEWLEKEAFEKQLAMTKQWLTDNPVPPSDGLPENLPGMD